MYMILDLLKDHQLLPQLGLYNLADRPECVVLTPRFRASSHILFLLFAGGNSKPALVVKVPRLAGFDDTVRREAANLTAIQASRPEGFHSIPNIVAVQEFHNRQILIETALSGRSMDPAAVRKDYKKCITMTMDWLVSIHQSTAYSVKGIPNWFEHLVNRPVQSFIRRIPLNEEEISLMNQTREAVAHLREIDIPIVFEHGDLSHPNIMILDQGGIGVVDWEQAEPLGLPACDLFFFLNYIASARNQSRNTKDYLSAFQSAFYSKNAWARPFIQIYSDRLQLPPCSLKPLFILTWFRYLTALLDRLSSLEASDNYVQLETAEWIRANRYYTLWRYAVLHLNELDFE
jgi:thiamine kinase-like enzyme